MNDRDEPAAPDLDAWFASERGYQEVPDAAVRAHLLAAIQQRVAGSGGGGSGGEGPGAATMATSKAVAGMIATFVVGGLVGAAVMHAAPAGVVVATSVASVAEASAPSVAAPTPEPPTPLASAAIEAPVASAASLAAKVPSGDARGAAAERALVDAARIALASGEPSQALDIVERHVRDYPQGRLVEEREAIAIRALVKASRYDEARERAARFQARYARSVAAPAVSAALRSIPEAP